MTSDSFKIIANITDPGLNIIIGGCWTVTVFDGISCRFLFGCTVSFLIAKFTRLIRYCFACIFRAIFRACTCFISQLWFNLSIFIRNPLRFRNSYCLLHQVFTLNGFCSFQRIQACFKGLISRFLVLSFIFQGDLSYL